MRLTYRKIFHSVSVPPCLHPVLFLLPLLFFALSVTATGQAPPQPEVLQDARITDISIINDRTMLYVGFRLEDGFPDEVRSAVHSGIPVTFNFDIILEIPGAFLDSTVVSKSLSRQITYDTIKGEYMVRYDLHAPRVFMVNGEDEACRLISTLEHIPLVRLSMLSRGETYLLRIRASAEKEKSSIAFPRMLSLFSSWGFETEWHEVKFNY